MKKLSLLILIILFFNGAFSQIAYYGAIKIKNGLIIESGASFKFNPDSVHALAAVLKAYLPDKFKNDPALTEGMVLNKFRSNPFFGKQIDTLLDAGAGADISSLLTNPISAVGGLDVTNLADGMARFIVNRAKKELNVFFFDKFRNRLDSIPELQILFPNTAQQFRIIGAEIYNYNAYITSLRESFEKDLSGLFVNFPKLLDDPKYAASFNDFPAWRLILKGSFHIISQLNNDVHPGDIIHEFPAEFGRDKVPENFYHAIQLLDVFSQSVRSADKNKYWIGSDSLNLLFDRITFRLYMGLVYQNTPDQIVFTNGQDTVNFKTDLLKKFGDNWKDDDILTYKNYIRDFGSAIEAVNISLKGIRGKSNDGKASYNDIFLFISASLDFFDHAVSFRELPYIPKTIKNSGFFNYYHTWSFVARQGSDLYLNINNRDYGVAILNVIGIYDTIFSGPFILNAAKGEDYYLSMASTKKWILKYGTFMANITRAKSSAEVESIIESTALPAGSSRIKRESAFNIALNSYLGMYVGHEFIQGISNWPVVNNYAVSAPIGVSVTWGGMKCNPKSAGWGIGGFISIVDLGALASFRVTDDTTASVAPTIQLQDIIAPGAFFTLNFPKSPFTLAIGAQMGPLLRSVDESSHVVSKNAYWRVGMTLTVDIPLLNIYNREQHRHK
jgi:hypothetical protein